MSEMRCDVMNEIFIIRVPRGPIAGCSLSGQKDGQCLQGRMGDGAPRLGHWGAVRPIDYQADARQLKAKSQIPRLVAQVLGPTGHKATITSRGSVGLLLVLTCCYSQVLLLGNSLLQADVQDGKDRSGLAGR